VSSQKNPENKTEFELDLSKLKPEDFDGHTDFDKLTPDQKLEWLSSAVQFYYEYGKWGKESRFYIEKKN